MEISIPRIETKQDVAYFVIRCERGTKTWEVRHRYSAFDELRKTVKAKAAFPSKHFGKLSAGQTMKRREQLEVWLKEVCELPELHKFLEEPEDETTWDESFMSSDPLAEPAPVRSPSPAAPAPAPAPAVQQEASPKKTGAAPSFLFASKMEYEPTGEGLRDAVKKGDLAGVEDLLKRDKTLANYQDRQCETMLHLAALFNHTEIALCLVKAGASIETKNQSDETPLDVALPALKAKILQVVK